MWLRVDKQTLVNLDHVFSIRVSHCLGGIKDDPETWDVCISTPQAEYMQGTKILFESEVKAEVMVTAIWDAIRNQDPYIDITDSSEKAGE